MPRNITPFFLTAGLAISTAAAPILPAVGATPPTGMNAVGQLVPVGAAVGDAGFAYVRLQNGVQLQVNGVTKNVLFYRSDIVRVNANLGTAYTTQPSLDIVTQPAPVSLTITESAATLRIASRSLQVLADRKTGALTFLRPDGTVITRERTAQPSEIKPTLTGGLLELC